METKKHSNGVNPLWFIFLVINMVFSLVGLFAFIESYELGKQFGFIIAMSWIIISVIFIIYLFIDLNYKSNKKEGR